MKSEASQTTQLHQFLEQPNSMEQVEMWCIFFLEHLFCISNAPKMNLQVVLRDNYSPLLPVTQIPHHSITHHC